MKKLRKKWYLFYGKVLGLAASLLGVSSCALIRVVQPCMYGVPRPEQTWKDSIKEPEVKPMYGVKPVTFQNVIEKDGVDIEIK